ncbi:prepilin-type N-terminal cleavage/methylation domain-containing protein [bacterium]|nr:prepilin-type N-terminal cleavage/methylation domain-containing protein [bacterium]
MARKGDSVMQHRMRTYRKATRGFSIIELLIAIIIIGILVSIAIPIIANRTKQAREARAMQDLEHYASAEERVAIDTAYYVRLFMLNDTVTRDSTQWERDAPNDTIQSYNYNTVGYFENQDRLFLDPQTGELVDGNPVGRGLLDLLQNNETSFNWNGPYVNWQKDSNNYTNTPDDDDGGLPDGIPDDPWGNNYLLFTRVGMVLEPNGDMVQTADFPIGSLSPILTAVPTDVFDRITVLSLGPNGLPGDGAGSNLGTGDDFVRSFGR